LSASTGGADARPVGALVPDLRRDLGLCAHRVKGDDAARHVEHVQERRDRGDLVRCGADGLPGEHEVLPRRPCRDHVEHGLGVVLVVAAAQRFAVDGDDFPGGLGGDALDPAGETTLEGVRLDGRDDAADGVGRGDALLKSEALVEPGLPGFSEDGDVVPAVGATHDSAEGDGEDVVEAMALPLGAPGVLDVVEVVSDQRRQGRVCRSLRLAN
jgi:hypothetical protein